ncbi:hypothetical protein [Streptomyces sp. NPDC056387]|uniref:hypothetical protein n=1 Tax=Streptomyces sp. NPDC056387 TaxID=3345803 RepID=UPI0035DAC27D
MLERKKLKNRTQVTFVLPEDILPGPVSVVGDFNQWNPAALPLTSRGDGTRPPASPSGPQHAFRYRSPSATTG